MNVVHSIECAFTDMVISIAKTEPQLDASMRIDDQLVLFNYWPDTTDRFRVDRDSSVQSPGDLMNVLRSSQNAIWNRRAEFHVLTYAEEGFAPLNIHTRDSALSKDQLVAFAASVNDRNEAGSLYPSAPVSAVPRALIRDLQDANALRQHIEGFFRANATSIHAKKVILDFRTPVVSRFVFDAIEEAIACPEAAFVDELVIVDDAAT